MLKNALLTVSKFGSRTSGTVLFGSAARVFALGSQFLVLLILSWILPKAQFGDAMTVFAAYRLLSLGIGTGIGNVVLYHVARSGGDHATDVRAMRTATVSVLALCAALIAVVLYFAAPISQFLGKPDIQQWIVGLAPLLLFGSLNTLLIGSLDGKGKITTSIVSTEVLPNALRLIGLFGALILFPTAAMVSFVLWLSVALPWAWKARHLWDRNVGGMQRWGMWEVRYAGFSMVTVAAGQQLQGLDMIVVGYLFSSTVAADYTIASRLAALYPFLQQTLLRTFAPRAGSLIANSQNETLAVELRQLREWSMITVVSLTGLLLIAAPIYLPIFGDYLSAAPILVALAFAPIFRGPFAGIDIVLKMSGRAGYGALISLVSAAFVIVVPLISWRWLGIYSLPLGMLVSAVVINPIAGVILNRQGTIVFDWVGLLVISIAAAPLITGLSQHHHPSLSAYIAGAGLLIVACALYYRTKLSSQKRTAI